MDSCEDWYRRTRFLELGIRGQRNRIPLEVGRMMDAKIYLVGQLGVVCERGTTYHRNFT